MAAAFKPLLTCEPPQRERITALDARRKKMRGKPAIGRATEEFERSLGKVGAHIGHLIDAFPVTQRAGNEELVRLLHQYSEVLKPWARQASARMIQEVNARDIEGWRALARELKSELKVEIQNTQVGAVMARLAAEQTELIASLPIDAAERLQRLTVKGLIEGAEIERIARAIERSGEVSESHARLIARTEVARTATNLTQARAEVAGFPLYRWRTSLDERVRPGHADMEGQVCEWANPPEVIENGVPMNFHPGTIWNCRCWAVPILE